MPGPERPDRPNVVLICVDQWRGDCLGVDGHPVVQTPFLNELALGGVRFSRAYSATPVCVPARAALFTGLSQRTHGRVGYRDGVPWDYPVTLAGEFTRHGYQTQAVGKMHVYPERSQVGFQNVILHDGYLHFARRKPRDYGLVDDYTPWLREQLGRDADYFDHGVDCNSYVARPWDKPEHTHPTNFVTSQSIDFLRRRDPRKPFFLYMSLHRPHPPYDPPAWAFEQYLHADMPEPPVGDWAELYAPLAAPARPDCMVGQVPPFVLRRARAGYYGHMTHIDHQVHRFMEALADYGAAANTWVCFVSDHGEMMGDHHLWRKGYPYEGSARVPLILAGPRGGGLRAASVRPEVAELRDVMPTLLDCAGLPVPGEVEGRSLLPLARGEAAAAAPRERLQGEMMMLGQSIQWLTDGREKYVWFSADGREQLFDLERDPHECTDLAREPGQAARVAQWRRALAEALAGREEGFSEGGSLIPGRPVNAVLSHLRGGG
jgi:arylsulfatase